MPEIVYGNHLCTNCGRTTTSWGVQVAEDAFLCEFCLRNAVSKIDDAKGVSQN